MPEVHPPHLVEAVSPSDSELSLQQLLLLEVTDASVQDFPLIHTWLLTRRRAPTVPKLGQAWPRANEGRPFLLRFRSRLDFHVHRMRSFSLSTPERPVRPWVPEWIPSLMVVYF